MAHHPSLRQDWSTRLLDLGVAAAVSALVARETDPSPRLKDTATFAFTCAFSSSFLLLTALRNLQPIVYAREDLKTNEEPKNEADPDDEVYADELTINSSSNDEEDSEDDEEEEDEERDRKMWLIRDLRRENEESDSLHFSRVCRACSRTDPQRRCVFITCGHAICSECADLVQSDADAVSDQIQCPICSTKGDLVQLYEEESEDNEERSNDETSVPRITRVCRVCYTDNPLHRAVFSACGHIICRACAWQLAIEADDWDGKAHADDAYEADNDDETDSEADEDDAESDSSEYFDADLAAFAAAEGSDDADISDDDEDSEDELEDDEDWYPLSCPLCKTEGGFGPLLEEMVQSDDPESVFRRIEERLRRKYQE